MNTRYDLFSRYRAPKMLYDFALPNDIGDVLQHAASGGLSVVPAIEIDAPDGLRYGLAFVRQRWVLACSVVCAEKRRAIPQAIRAAVLLRDGGRCTKCGARDDVQLDHIVPWSYGGPDTVENLQCLCGKCNRRKWHQDKRAAV